jgi:hypothetical protein
MVVKNKTVEEIAKSIVDWHKQDVKKKIGNKKRHKQ